MKDGSYKIKADTVGGSTMVFITTVLISTNSVGYFQSLKINFVENFLKIDVYLSAITQTNLRLGAQR